MNKLKQCQLETEPVRLVRCRNGWQARSRSLLILMAAILFSGQMAGTLNAQIFTAPGGGWWTIGAYNATTGATINSGLISSGVDATYSLAVSGSDLLVGTRNKIEEYNATTGAAINLSFITGLYGPTAVALSASDLYVANHNGNEGDISSIGEYNATTGAAINSSLITGLGSGHYVSGMAVSGSDLFVAYFGANTIGEYNTTTGAAINPSFITGLSGPSGLAVSGRD